MQGRLHLYHPKRRLTLFEAQPNGPREPQPNALLFIGGMYDNFLNPKYVSDIAISLASEKWSVFHVQLSSAGTQFGMSSLDKDIEQIHVAVDFIRNYVRESWSGSMKKEDGNVVLMGHSTGCQDTLHYLTAPVQPGTIRATVQGAILQAPASDRETILQTVRESEAANEAYENLLAHVKTIPEEQWSQSILPFSWTRQFFGPVPMSMTRFMSLASPGSPTSPGTDDLFSSDLDDKHLAKTFGAIGDSQIYSVSKNTTLTSAHSRKPQLLVLMSGSDEYVPQSIDKHQLLSRWRVATKRAGRAELHPSSGIISGANHAVEGNDAVAKAAKTDLIRCVKEYLHSVCPIGNVEATDALDMSSVQDALDVPLLVANEKNKL